MSLASLLLTFASVVPAGQIVVNPTVRQVYARVDVSQEGRIEKIRFRNRMSENVEAALRERAMSWSFDPVTKDGVPARATAILLITIEILRSEDGGASLTITHVIHGPEPVRIAAPKFTPSQAGAGLHGLVVVRCHITRRGRCQEQEAEPTDAAPVLVANALKVMTEWRFEPEFIGGAAVDTWVRIPICFDAQGNGEYRCPAPAAMPPSDEPESGLQFHWPGKSIL